MNTAENSNGTTQEHRPTAELAQWLGGLSETDISQEAWSCARHALLDWFGVTIAGASEPLVDILVDELAGEGAQSCSVVGRGFRTSATNAALINGATSHALDYDDVNRRLMGHPTVPVAPVALALAEQNALSGKAVLAGIIAGVEVECLIGEMAGEGHYDLGFHNTATIGTFGATGTACHMLGLDAGTIRHAFGIAASYAGGLKSNFGTMTKPLHAGNAASHGLFSARLASRGFTANEDILEVPQGTAAVMMPGFVAGHVRPHPHGYYSVQRTLFKYHAACYMIHSTIDAIREQREKHGLSLDDLKAMTLYVEAGHFKVCNIPDPDSGLGIKFSIRHCAAMAMDGVDTAALDTYSKENALNPRYSEGRHKVSVEAIEGIDRWASKVKIELLDGRVLECEHDVSKPETDLDAQWQRLCAKFDSLAIPVIGAQRAKTIVDQIETLEQRENISELMNAAR